MRYDPGMKEKIGFVGIGFVEAPRCPGCNHRLEPHGDHAWRCESAGCSFEGKVQEVLGCYPFKVLGGQTPADV